jgi:hypothetical protein
VKLKYIYLYLTLACFLGIILIFIFDGYMGVYDTLVMDNGQYPQTIEADQWSEERYGYLASTGVERGGRVDFTYKVANRRFSAYNSDIEISFMHNQEIITDVITETLVIDSFDEGELTWFLDTSEIIPADYPLEQSYNVNMVISREDIERKVLINIYPSPYASKPVLIEPSR